MTGNDLKIISNNPLVKTKYPLITELLDISILEILMRTRDYIHLGAKLLNHPQSGGLLTGENPYKSLVLEDLCKDTAMTTDFFSVNLIEKAIEQIVDPPTDFINYDKKTLYDFQVIDLDMLETCAKKFE